MSGLHAITANPDDIQSGDGPVAVFLHGYGSHERDLAALGSWLPGGIAWVALRAPLALPNGGNAWFSITVPGDPDAEPVAMATGAIWSWVDEHLGQDARTIPIGFSQGGLMATQMLRTRPERVAATVVLGGFVQSGEQPGDGEIARKRPPVFWGRGAEDRVITSAAVIRTEQWLTTHTTLTERVYEGLGHGIDPTEMRDMRRFLTESAATVRPASERASGDV